MQIYKMLRITNTFIPKMLSERNTNGYLYHPLLIWHAYGILTESSL